MRTETEVHSDLPIQFILNDTDIEIQTSTVSPGYVLVDFIRRHQRLTGTTTACREGDCGACTVLVGEIGEEGDLSYRSITSCIYPVGNVSGKHVVTVEGVSAKTLNPVQAALEEHTGTQCGFCTPGFVVSLVGYFLTHQNYAPQEAISAIDGNICRCTGYKSIERAVAALCDDLQQKNDAGVDRISALIEWGLIPEYFRTIQHRLRSDLQKNGQRDSLSTQSSGRPIVGGGTDLYVQRPEEMVQISPRFTSFQQSLKGISIQDRVCTIGSATTIEEIRNSPLLEQSIPEIKQLFKLFGSTQIRNSATIGGNLVNASPIGDSTAFFLALGSDIILRNHEKTRQIPLHQFYKGYKTIDLKDGEFVAALSFALLEPGDVFHFEKVSRRIHLDIASVNSGCWMKCDAGNIQDIRISAGGVSATPLLLHKTAQFLRGKALTAKTVQDAVTIAQSEISPISDARGSSEYKRLLLRQFLYAHFIRATPTTLNLEGLV